MLDVRRPAPTCPATARGVGRAALRGTSAAPRTQTGAFRRPLRLHGPARAGQ